MNIFNLGGLGQDPTTGDRATRAADAQGSPKGCRSASPWQLPWNNPSIHTPERREVWLACGEHRAWLEDFLQTRGLWKVTLPLTASRADAGVAPGGVR